MRQLDASNAQEEVLESTPLERLRQLDVTRHRD